jgi:hypothetical protein
MYIVDTFVLKTEVGLRRFLTLILATFILFLAKRYNKIAEKRSLFWKIISS